MPMRPLLASLALATTLLCGACASTAPAPASAPTGFAVEVPAIQRPQGETTAWWFRAGAAQAAARGAMSGRARNVILFVGDGMSLTTVAAARILEGQRRGQPGEETRLSWEDFPATAFSRTYNTDSQTPDSAGTMSAMATGVKTRAGVISIGPEAARGDCAQALAAPVATLWELAAAAGMDAGIVTTTRVTHATPGAAFTHAGDRGWEHDAAMPAAARAAGCTDIARQLVESPYAPGLKVLMGGGRANFLPATASDPEYPGTSGRRTDGRDLVAEWSARHPGGAYVWNAAQLERAPTDVPLLGLFEPSHMHFEHDRADDGAGEPDLATMTRAAIRRLQGNPQGYVLLVEGGRIDHAHHGGNAFRALSETIALSDAVRAASAMTSADDTLILVTADHSHTMTFAGYPARGNPILGTVATARGTSLDAGGKPYTTLGYANGPGYTGPIDGGPAGRGHTLRGAIVTHDGRPDLRHVDTTAPDYLQEATVPLADETHGGEDVGIWARGPGSAAVRGNLEQNAIFHLLLQATPRLREAACRAGGCDANGVPVEPMDLTRLRR